jgi:hypothetical protein
METYQVELISIDEIDSLKDVSAKITVQAGSEEEALRKAKEAIQRENIKFNMSRVWAFHLERKPLR